MTSERSNIQLTFYKGDILPTAGQSIIMYGFAGAYSVSIHRIKKTILHDDGSVSLAVNATKRLIEPVQQASTPESEGGNAD